MRILMLFLKQGIDRKEARVNAMRAAILETFPEPNRRLLQRWYLCLCYLLALHLTGVLIYIILT